MSSVLTIASLHVGGNLIHLYIFFRSNTFLQKICHFKALCRKPDFSVISMSISKRHEPIALDYIVIKL